MVITLIVFLAIVYTIGARFGLRPGFRVRFLTSAVRMQRNRKTLVAMCPVMPSVPAEVAKTLPIHLAEWGDTGPKVLLIHGGVQGGLGGGPATFVEQKALADRGWRLLAVERPGFGRSPSRGPDDMAGDAELVDTHMGEGAHLIGHSFGGAVSLLAAARRPSVVRSLTLIEPALIPLIIGSKVMKSDNPAREDFLCMIEAWGATRTPADYARTLMQNLGVAPAGNAVSLENGGGFDEERAAWVGCSFLRARIASRGMLQKAASAVAAAKIPVLVITGGWSPTFEAVGDIAADLAGGRHVVVPSPDHFVQMSGADMFNAVVDEFLQAAESSAQADDQVD